MEVCYSVGMLPLRSPSTWKIAVALGLSLTTTLIDPLLLGYEWIHVKESAPLLALAAAAYAVAMIPTGSKMRDRVANMVTQMVAVLLLLSSALHWLDADMGGAGGVSLVATGMSATFTYATLSAMALVAWVMIREIRNAR